MRLTTTALLVALAATGAISGDVAAQAQRAGVVTTATGTVTVARDAASPAPLRFRDEIYLHDRIATAESSPARILLGGKAVVTGSERSVVTITEAPGRSTIDLVSGRISLAVARERMKPGDTVEIRTPIAIAGVRGTVVIAETLDGGAAQFTVVKGLVEVAALDPRTRLTLPGSTFLAARQTLVATPRGIGAPQNIPPEAAQRLGAAFKPAPPQIPTAPASLVRESQVKKASEQAQQLLSRGRDGRGDRGRGSDRGRGTDAPAIAGDALGASSTVSGLDTPTASGHPGLSAGDMPAVAIPKTDVPKLPKIDGAKADVKFGDDHGKKSKK